MKNIEKMTFVEVRCDYLEPDTNIYYIDAWESDDDDCEGISVATVDVNGVVDWRVFGFNPSIHHNITEAIKEAIEKQLNR